MSSSHFTSSIYLLTFALLLQTIFGEVFLNCMCSDEEFTSDLYLSNIQTILSSIAIKTPSPGFGLASIGQNQSQINSLALCRGDANTTGCKTCVDEAINEIRKQCQYNKGAIIWYDNCLLKYSNSNFFTQVDNDNTFYMSSNIVVSQPTIFNQQVRDLLNRLAKEATAVDKLYAAGELMLGGSNKLYGMVQCTLDLSNSDCSGCLDDAINGELRLCCNGKDGGRFVGGSCNVRYEVNPFLNA